MDIKWNEVTWYSKLLSVIFLLIIFPALTFYFGTIYKQPSVEISSGFSSLPVFENEDCQYSRFTEDHAPWWYTGGGDELPVDYGKEGWCKHSISKTGPTFIFHLVPNPDDSTDSLNNYFPSFQVFKTDGTLIQDIPLINDGLLAGNQPYFIDANFDGLDDISFPVEQAQCSRDAFFLYNPKTGKFESNDELGLNGITNASFDSQTKIISGSCSSSAFEGVQSKSRIENGKLVTFLLSQRVCKNPGETVADCRIITSELVDGKLVETKNVPD